MKKFFNKLSPQKQFSFRPKQSKAGPRKPAHLVLAKEDGILGDIQKSINNAYLISGMAGVSFSQARKENDEIKSTDIEG